MATKVPLQSITLTSDVSSITFSGISQSYSDLQLVIRGTIATSNNTYRVQFNGDTSGTYSYTTMGTTSGGQGSYRGTSVAYIPFFIMNGGLDTSMLGCTMDIMNYTGTTTKKSSLVKSACGDGEISLVTGLWSSTSAITSMTIITSAGNLAAGSTFDLYGIKSGAPQALGGDLVTTDGNYWYHAFRTSGTFTPLRSLTADYLVVAGGGGGGLSSPYGGGGGAGGFRTSTSNALTAGSYTVTVGAGGSAGVPGTAGSASTFNSFSASGGGLGGNDNTSGGSGGSGGGGRSSQNGSNTVNTNYGAGNAGGYSPVEGYRGAGGWMNFAVSGAGGGGGGAGAIGGDPSAGAGGTGGIGSFTTISGGATTGLGILSGGNYYFAGGGGGAGLNSGGNGGSGGGGNGSAGTGGAPTGGNANTGGGGGGTYGSNTAGSGGSGIVIVRYAV